MNILVEFKEVLRKFGIEYFNRYYASYRGFVHNNEDPNCLGRVQLMVPQIYGDDFNDYWAFPKGMFLGKQIGMYAIPNIGDLVWVSFENGDPRYPIWEYGHWADGDPITALVDRDIASRHVILWQSTSGQRIELDDDNQCIKIISASGATVLLDKDSRISVMNGQENLKDIIKDTLSEIANLEIITPAGDGFVGPLSLQALLKLQIRLLNLLK